jgi:hypothetical protein
MQNPDIHRTPRQKAKQLKLQAKLASLLAGKPNSEQTTTCQLDTLPTAASPEENMPADAREDLFLFEDEVPPLTEPQDSIPPLNTSEFIPNHRILPDIAAARLYDTWKILIPTLVDVQLKYTQRTIGKILKRPPMILSACHSQKCAQRRTTMIGLFFDVKSQSVHQILQVAKDVQGFTSLDILSCRCATAPQVLVLHGLFPTSPSQPCMAVSTELLAFY